MAARLTTPSVANNGRRTPARQEREQFGVELFGRLKIEHMTDARQVNSSDPRCARGDGVRHIVNEPRIELPHKEEYRDSQVVQMVRRRRTGLSLQILVADDPHPVGGVVDDHLPNERGALGRVQRRPDVRAPKPCECDADGVPARAADARA